MLERVADLVREGRRFLVTMHRRPDGDALGSSLALACALREMGKDVVHYNPDPVPTTCASSRAPIASSTPSRVISTPRWCATPLASSASATPSRGPRRGACW